MKNRLLLLVCFCLVSFAVTQFLTAQADCASGPSDFLSLSGKVTNSQGKPVKDVELTVHVNGKAVDLQEKPSTSKAGIYQVELELPHGTLPGAKVEVEMQKPCYGCLHKIAVEKIVEERRDDRGNIRYLAHQSFSLERSITPAFRIATGILILVYGLIAFELMHRTLAAFLGATLLLATTYTLGTFDPGYAIITFQDAMQAIDMNVILLLMSMMIVVGILKNTGVFQWMAYKSYQLAGGNVFILSGSLVVVTAVASAFLDNVTTMLLVIPVTIEIALTLKLNPLTLLMPEVFASNVGGTATLIGDPPNIMIGSYAKLTFMQFIENLAVICAVCLVFTAFYYIFRYRREYAGAKVGDVQSLIARLREEYKITNKTLLVQGGVALGITIMLFIFHGALHMEPSIAAMIGAVILLLVSRVDIVELLERDIEWPTLIFFIMLFIVVAGAEETGLIQVIAEWVKDMSKGSLVTAILLILWVSAIASAIIDNIPFTATMLPIVAYLTTEIPGAQGGILWWALALGGLPRWKWNVDRRQRKRSHRRDGRTGRLPDLFHAVRQGGFRAHARDHCPLFDLASVCDDLTRRYKWRADCRFPPARTKHPAGHGFLPGCFHERASSCNTLVGRVLFSAPAIECTPGNRAFGEVRTEIVLFFFPAPSILQ